MQILMGMDNLKPLQNIKKYLNTFIFLWFIINNVLHQSSLLTKFLNQNIKLFVFDKLYNFYYIFAI